MKLTDIKFDWVKAGLDTISLSELSSEDKKIVASTMKCLIYQNGWRDIKTPFYILNAETQRPDSLIDYWSCYLSINTQKIKYLCESAKQDFLTSTSTSHSSGNDTSNVDNIDYNVDYYGGEGQTGKDTHTNTSNSSADSSSTSIDNWRKINNFYSLSNNVLFRMFFNNILVIWEEGEGW